MLEKVEVVYKCTLLLLIITIMLCKCQKNLSLAGSVSNRGALNATA